MSDELNEDEHNTQGVPSEDGGSDADTASGGAPDEDVDPETGTDENGNPVENPSGG